MPETKKETGQKGCFYKAVLSFKNFLKESTEDSFFHKDIDEIAYQTDQEKKQAPLLTDITTNWISRYIEIKSHKIALTQQQSYFYQIS